MRIDRRRRRPVLVIAAAAAIAVSGCGSAATPAPTPTPAPTSAPRTSAPARADCAEVVAKGQTLATTAVQFVGGDASQEQVSAAAQDLNDALTAAKSTLPPAAGTQVSDVQNDLRQLVDALTARPIDLAGVRTAANSAAAGLRQLASVCATPTPGAPTS